MEGLAQAVVLVVVQELAAERVRARGLASVVELALAVVLDQGQVLESVVRRELVVDHGLVPDGVGRLRVT